jgi:hypothetical protein
MRSRRTLPRPRGSSEPRGGGEFIKKALLSLEVTATVRIYWKIRLGKQSGRASPRKKELKGSFPCYVMTRRSKKRKSDELDSKKMESEEAGSSEPEIYKITSDQTGIDGVRVLQLFTVGCAILLLVWFVLHNVLHVI